MSRRAVARRTDPETSWAAARSLPSDYLRASQRYVLELLQIHGPMTDEELVMLALEGGLSLSGARTRRSELVDMGLVFDTGRWKLTRARRKSIVWQARYIVDNRPTLWD